MNRFAELLDRLAYETGRNNKLRLLTKYFREVEDPDRGYALAALTGALSFKHAKPGLIRDLIAARTDPVLFALSYDCVGDLSETVALMWPRSPSHAQSAPSPACGQGYRIWLSVAMRKASSQPARLILRRMDARSGWARRMLRASLRRMARFSGALSFRARLPSSAKWTSSTQWSWFSIAQ